MRQMKSSSVRPESQRNDPIHMGSQKVKYFSTKVDLLDALKKQFKLTGDAVLSRTSEQARTIFKTSLSQDEFIRELT